MPIISSREQLLSLSQAAKSVPRIDGRSPHASTVFRWAKKGLNGIKLEYLKVGGRIVTSVEAMDRFYVGVAEADQRAINIYCHPAIQTKKPRIRSRQIDAAEKSLRKAGF